LEERVQVPATLRPEMEGFGTMGTTPAESGTPCARHNAASTPTPKPVLLAAKTYTAVAASPTPPPQFFSCLSGT